jgi:hypothetical protein
VWAEPTCTFCCQSGVIVQVERSERHVKGSNLVDLVKVVKKLQKRAPLPPLAAVTQRVLSERLLDSVWYPLSAFIELFAVVDALVLRGDEARALEMGAAGGAVALTGQAKMYLQPGDPRASVVAMRHAWRARHDFGELEGHLDGDHAVRFRLTGYDDLTMPHAMTTAGWGVAAARAAGSTVASADILERPWRGDPCFMYRIRY